MVKTKKIPMRMCLGCRHMKPQRELVRIVRTQETALCVDKTYKMQGRGAYICRSSECLKKAIKSKARNRAFELNPDEALINALESELADAT